MNEEDYEIYHKKGGEYVIPVEIFNEIFDEIERLNNIIKQQDTRNSRQRIANRKLLDRNQDLVIENLKLNNIINELERYIVYQLQILNTPEDYYTGTYVRDILFRLRELKDSE